MTTGELSNAGNLDPRQYAETLVTQYSAALDEAVRTGYPEDIGKNPLEVFPSPTKKRSDAPDPGWNDNQASEMRRIVGEFGFGRETDLTLSAQGLLGADVYYEPGQPHKIRAQVESVAEDYEARPSAHIFGGNPLYKITSSAEQASAVQQYGFVPEDQYQLARVAAEHMEGFVPLAGGDEVLSLSYGDKQHGFAAGQEPSGQFVKIGHTNGEDVILLRIDGEEKTDESGKQRLVNHPQPADVMKIISNARSLEGIEDRPLVFETSATYEASRRLAAALTGLETDRVIAVASYGTARLARVKAKDGEDISAPEPAALNQIPGELHVTARTLDKLGRALRTPIEEKYNLQHATPEQRLQRNEALLAMLVDLAIDAGPRSHKFHELLDNYRAPEDRVMPDIIDDELEQG